MVCIKNKSPVASAPTELDGDIHYFKIQLLMSIRKRLLSNKNGVKTYEYFGGVGRQEDINVYQFYQHHGSKMPELNAIISQLLGQPEASHTPEKIFSRGGHVLNKFRTSLLCARSEKLILSSYRFYFKLFGNDCFNIPTCGQLFTTEELNQVQEHQEKEVAEIAAF